MNVDRLLRDVEGSLADLDDARRFEVLDAVREAIARERRMLGPSLTVEVERERRRNAEELRRALEAISRPTHPEEALAEVLSQLGRVVAVDYAVVVAADPETGFRVLAVRGSEEGSAGAPVVDPRLDTVRQSRQPMSVADAEAEEAPVPVPGAPALRAWTALPLLLEGDVVGLLVTGRLAADPFTEDELIRVKAVAFWAAATLGRGRLVEHIRRYASMLEQVIAVHERVFEEADPDGLAQIILQSACRIGGYRGGLLVLQTPRGPLVAATAGEAFAPALGRAAPPDLAATVVRRLGPERMLEVAETLKTELPAERTYLVPLATADAYVGCLALLDPDGESPDDRLMEAYGARAAAAWLHVAGQQARNPT
jgi:GAF domain